MGKMTTYLAIMSGLVLLFYFGGLLDNTISSTLLTLVLNPSNLESSNWFTMIMTLAAGVIGVVSTFVARNQNSDFYMMIPVAMSLFSFGWDFLVIYQTVAVQSEVAGVVAAMIFGPLMLMYVLAVVDWWRGIEA